jgi:hypothetical protein
MLRKFAFSIGLTVSLCGIPVAAAGQSGRFQSLIENNPFATEKPPPIVEPAPPPQYEFRGMMVEDGVRYFSIHDLSTKRSAWVRLKEPTGSFQLTDFDPGRNTLTVAAAGRTARLDMKQAVIKPGQAITALARATPAGSGPTFVAAPAILQSAQSETQHLEQVADLIRERREQRTRRLASAAPSRI